MNKKWNRFTEFEHKYITSAESKPFYLSKIQSLRPHKHYNIDVEDWYFIPSSPADHILRYRRDSMLSQLSIKSLRPDAEIRLEVNLELKANQTDLETVEQFLSPFGITWKGLIEKRVWVYYFPECEIVFYEAMHKGRSLSCIELEVISPEKQDSPRDVLKKYETLLGLDPEQRSKSSLFQLLCDQTS